MNLETLPGPLVGSLRLAWEATTNGTIGVGAVIQAPDGQLLGSGRNQVMAAGPDPLALNCLAHAEMNAIANVAPSTDLSGAVLWTTLEPCLMCAGALVLAKIDRVQVLSCDPFQAGVNTMQRMNEWTKERWPARVFHHDAAWAGIGRILSLYQLIDANPRSRVALSARDKEPEIYAITKACIEAGLVASLVDEPLETFVAHVSSDVGTLR